jgi:phosphotransferase system IIB component
MLNISKARELIENIEEYQLILNNQAYDKYKSEMKDLLIETIKELYDLANDSLCDLK